MTTMVDCIFPAVSSRDKINGFIDHCLLSHGQNERDLPDQDAITSGFVFIRRFPKLSEKTIDKYSDLMHMGLATVLNQGRTLQGLTFGTLLPPSQYNPSTKTHLLPMGVVLYD